MLQQNQITGLLFIAGIFLGSWRCGVAGILAAITGCFTAQLLKFDRREIEIGLYAFSPILVGVALVYFFDDSILTWGQVIIGGVFASLLQHLFIIKKIPGFTFPFILVTWILFYFNHQILNIQALSSQPQILAFPYGGLLAGTNAFGEVIFQENALSGILIFMGVLICNPIAAFYGLLASLLGAGVSFTIGQPFEKVYLGIFGFNALLTAIAFSGYRKKDVVWVIAGSVITIYINILFHENNIFQLVGGAFTLPFVVGSWIILLLNKWFLKN